MLRATLGVILAVIVAVPAAQAQVSNFHQVTDFLYRSGRPAESDFDDFKQLGIHTVLTLETYFAAHEQSVNEEKWAHDRGITLLRLPMSGIEKPTVGQVEEALRDITDSTYQPILVHCKEGSDRTGIVIAAYRMKYQHWTLAEAKAEMRELGHSSLLFWWDDVLSKVE